MTHFKYYSCFAYVMVKEQIIKQLERDNKSDFEQLNLTNREYKKLKDNWLNKDTEDFEIVCQIELRKQVIEKLNNFQQS